VAALENRAIDTEILNLQVVLDESGLLLSSQGSPLIRPVALSPEDAERLRLEMAKAQLREWNQFEGQKARAELRYRRYLAAWLVMCLAAFSVYVGYPDFYLPIFFLLLSVFLWWRAGYEEQRAEREAQVRRDEFRPDWEYIRRRLEEDATA
jgi:hypothetical protein